VGVQGTVRAHAFRAKKKNTEQTQASGPTGGERYREKEVVGYLGGGGTGGCGVGLGRPSGAKTMMGGLPAPGRSGCGEVSAREASVVRVKKSGRKSRKGSHVNKVELGT